MIEIGKKLQKRREELKLTYEEISAITKLSIPHIKAIEAGDLDYFKNDLTYVRFYVARYCKAIDVPYENFKDDVIESVEDYTSTLTIKKQEQKEQIEKVIEERSVKKPSNIIRKEVETLLKEQKGPKLAKKDRASISQNAQQNRRFTKKKVDIPMLSFFVVLGVIACILVYVGVGAIFDKDEEEPPVVDTPPVVEKVPTPEPEVEKPIEEEKKEEIKITKDNANSYTVTNVNVKDKIKIEVLFTENKSWFDGTFNATPLEGGNKIYGPNQTFTIEKEVGTSDVYELRFGFYPGTKIKVNGTSVKLDPSLDTAGNVQTIYINVKGE